MYTQTKNRDAEEQTGCWRINQILLPHRGRHDYSHQVHFGHEKYANKSLVSAGITSIGLCGKDSVCVVTQKKNIPEHPSPLVNVTHLVPVTKYLGMLITCPTSHVKEVVEKAKEEAYMFRRLHRREIPVDELAKWIYRYSFQSQLQNPGTVLGAEYSLPYPVVAMVLGIDEEKKPQLFKCDREAGHFFGNKVASVGLKEQEAINFLEKEMKNDLPFSCEEACQAAINALKTVLQADLKASEIEVGVVRVDNPNFEVLSTKRIDEYLTALSKRDRKFLGDEEQ